MAYVPKELEWKRLYDFSQFSQVAELPRGRYVVENYNDTYRWGYTFDNEDFGDTGFFYCDSIADGKEMCEKNYKSRILRTMNEVTAYHHIAELTATGIDGAIENDTIEIVIDTVTYTFTADADGVFGDYVATGTADTNLVFDIDETTPAITVTNALESFTVTSNTITLGGVANTYDSGETSVATEI